MNVKQTAFLGVKWSAVGTLGASFFQLLQIAILTRFLPKEAFGLVAMALFVVQFSSVFADMGMTSAILHKQEVTHREYSSVYWFNLLIAVVLYGILLLAAPLIAVFYNEPELGLLVPVMGVNIVVMASGRIHRTIMQKHFQFKSISLIEIFSFFIGLITAITLAVLDFGVYSLVYSTLLTSVLSNSLFLIRNLRQNPVFFHFKMRETSSFLKIGGYSTGSIVLDFFSRETDVLLIGKLLGAEQLGLYSLSKQIVLKVYAILNPIVINVLNPLLSSIQDEKEKMKTYALKAVHIIATVNFPIYLLLIVMSKEVLTILYGPDYTSGYLVLSFYALFYAIHSMNNPAGSLQIATGRTYIGFYWSIFRVIATSVVVLLASRLNIYVVAGSIAVLQLFFIIPIWWIQYKPLAKISLTEYLKQFWVLLLVLLLVSVVALFVPVYDSSAFGVVASALVKAAGSLFLFSGLLFLFHRVSFNLARDLFKSIVSRKW